MGVVLIRVLVKLGLGFSRRRGEIGGVEVVKRRDRSLGGREVVVERKVLNGGEGLSERDFEVMPRNSARKEERKLPNWWPVVGPRPVVDVGREEYRREANKLVQG